MVQNKPSFQTVKNALLSHFTEGLWQFDVGTNVRRDWGPRCANYPWNITYTFFSRGLWTWPPWVICASAFNHKIGNAAHSGVSEVLLFTKSYKWKKKQCNKWTTGRLLLESMRFWWFPTVRQFKMAARRMWAQFETSPCGLTMVLLFSVISLQHFLRWKFRNMFTE